MNHSQIPPRICGGRGTTRIFVAALSLTTLVLAGCGGGADEAEVVEITCTEPETRMNTLQYADSLGVDFAQMQRTASGVCYNDVVTGTGAEAADGNAVTVHYTGYSPDGTSFDSSRPREEPFVITLGAGQVIQGWEQGIPGMRVGGRRTLVIPPELAYGVSGHPAGIPPNAVLVFDVELLAVN